jgi:hypothetical protein
LSPTRAARRERCGRDTRNHRGECEHRKRADRDRKVHAVTPGRHGVVGKAPDHECRKPDAEDDPEDRTDQRRDDTLVPHHPSHLTPRHSHRPERAELSRALDDREHERVYDPEEAHEHGQPEQHVEELQHLVEPGVLTLHELGLRTQLDVGVRA